MNIVLLGSTGFVGTAIRRSVENRDDVSVHALIRNTQLSVERKNIRWVEGRVENCPEALFPSEPFVVVHFANKQVDDGSGFDCNFANTQAFLERLPSHCRGVIYGSSMSVYGSGSQVRIGESSQCRPDTPLAQSRFDVEQLVHRVAEMTGTWGINLRPRFIIGDGDKHLLPGIKQSLKKGVRVGSGEQAFSVIDVDDYANIVLRLVERVLSDKRAKQIALNVGYDSPVTMKCFERALGEGTQKRRVRIPVSSIVNKGIRKIMPKLESTIEKLNLVGLSHSADVNRLRSIIGGELVDQNPIIKVRNAAARAANEAI